MHFFVIFPVQLFPQDKFLKVEFHRSEALHIVGAHLEVVKYYFEARKDFLEKTQKAQSIKEKW